MFGLYELDGPEVSQAYKTLQKTFEFTNEQPAGLPRYEHDQYNLSDPASLGNPWFVTTLWIAQYHIERHDLQSAERFIRWVAKHMTTSGVLSEQINPHNGEFVSVAPLAWSQAEFVNTLLDIAIEPPAIPAEETIETTAAR